MNTPRTPVWKSIAATLEGDIASGHYAPGDKLPTEAALAARFGVNRHTVRRALADLGGRGILRSRRGAGVFVEAPPTERVPLPLQAPLPPGALPETSHAASSR